MITKRKLRWEVARLRANTGFLEYTVDTLAADNDALLKERNELREKLAAAEADNKALLETVAMLCDKDKQLTKENRSMKLRIMSLEALWCAKQRRMENAQSA